MPRGCIVRCCLLRGSVGLLGGAQVRGDCSCTKKLSHGTRRATSSNISATPPPATALERARLAVTDRPMHGREPNPTPGCGPLPHCMAALPPVAPVAAPLPPLARSICPDLSDIRKTDDAGLEGAKDGGGPAGVWQARARLPGASGACRRMLPGHRFVLGAMRRRLLLPCNRAVAPLLAALGAIAFIMRLHMRFAFITRT
jgi:hypothetical protein